MLFRSRALSVPFGPGPEPRSGSSCPLRGRGAEKARKVESASRRPARSVSRLGTALPGAGGRAQPRPYPGGISAALQPVHVQPLKGSPVLRRRGRWSETTQALACVGQNPGATPCSANQAHPRRRPQLSKACPEYRVGERRKDCCDFGCEFTGERTPADTERIPASTGRSASIRRADLPRTVARPL